MNDGKGLIIVSAIALGVPVLFLLAVMAGNPGIAHGLGTSIALVLVLGTFFSAMFFELKRLADLPSNEGGSADDTTSHRQNGH